MPEILFGRKTLFLYNSFHQPALSMKRILLLYITTLSVLICSSQTTYTFTGNGNWTIAANWSNNIIPPGTLPAGSTIYISPPVGSSCILNITQTISAGATLIVSAGANFIITGNMISNDNIPVTICNQTWTLKNLDLNTYKNGDTIPLVTDPVLWSNLTTGAWRYYDNNADTGAIYGRLYNWYAVNDSRGLAPEGWHIPTNLEWGVLAGCLGGELIAGGPLKDTGFLHWYSPNSGATNSSGFTGLPGGRIDSSGFNSNNIGFYGFFWSADSVSTGKAWYSILNFGFEGLGRTGYSFRNGLSVRCIKNTLPILTTVPPEVTATNTISGGIISSDGGKPVTVKGVVWSTVPNPTIALSTKTNNGTGVAFYYSYINGLQPGTTYNIRAYATSSLGTGYGNEISFVNTVADSAIVVCSQRWMTKNLQVTTYRNGNIIPQVTDPTQWANLTTGAWCYYDNDPATASVYGKLYNWYAVNDPRGLAPAGWHIPSLAELSILSTCLGGDAVAGGALKETGTAHWLSPNTGATNTSGFTGLPGGFRSEDGVFYELGRSGNWWTTSPSFTNYANYMNIDFESGFMNKPNANHPRGYAVRCLRD